MAGASEHKSPNAAEMSANRLPGNAVASESSEDAAAAMNNNNNNSNNSIPATPEAASKAKENLEKVLKLDDELQLMISRRKELEKSIAQIEAQLYNTEKKVIFHFLLF
jgi:chromosome segregation ATPase